MDEKLYEGYLSLGSNGEADDILYLSSEREPLAEVFMDDLVNKNVTISYYVSEKEVTLEEAQEKFMNQLFGVVDAEYSVVYSDITGYLWTNEEIMVGGHDLLEELRLYIGKYIILFAEIS